MKVSLMLGALLMAAPVVHAQGTAAPPAGNTGGQSANQAAPNQAGQAQGQPNQGQPNQGQPAQGQPAQSQANQAPAPGVGGPPVQSAGIPPGMASQLPVIGTLVAVDKHCNAVTVKSEGTSRILQVAADTKIMIDGQAASGIGSLKEGQHVKAAFNDAGVLKEMTVLSQLRANPETPAPGVKPAAPAKKR